MGGEIDSDEDFGADRGRGQKGGLRWR